MNYKNGEQVFPPKLLEELQKYVQGELVYIPRLSTQRAAWGEMSGARAEINHRNSAIYEQYRHGLHVSALAVRYHLSEDSIRKIIVKFSRQNRSS
ncbi:MAG: CD3324 family protein [Clostridia bacterium]|nr:CD3324 family protein [Clostridia bacterium]